MRATTATLLGVLAAAAGLWLWSRSSSGQVLIVDALESVLDGPRGIRNNNPGNIDWIKKPSKRWRGMIRQETAAEGGRFGVFDTMANGVRAIGGELKVDARRGVRTVRELISNWAPSNENDTTSYMRTVAAALNVTLDQRIDVELLVDDLVEAIIKHENGGLFWITRADIANWVRS